MSWRVLALLFMAFPLASVGGCGQPSGESGRQESCPLCPPGGPEYSPANHQQGASGPASPGEETSGAEQRQPQGRQPGTAQDKPAVSVEVIGGPAFKRALKKYQGKVVLVDFWATWCGPCVEMFPKTVDLHRRFAERGLVLVAVSMDDPEDKTRVAEFLAEHGATFPNYISRYGVGTEAAEAFGVGVLPTYKLYDRQGELVKEFSGAGIDSVALEREIEKLLAQP